MVGVPLVNGPGPQQGQALCCLQASQSPAVSAACLYLANNSAPFLHVVRAVCQDVVLWVLAPPHTGWWTVVIVCCTGRWVARAALARWFDCIAICVRC
jgi:hypothetical protein